MNQSVKLSKLRLSASNVRTAPDAALMIEPFAADLEARGVLQNLLVTPVARSRGMFEVFDGGRRLRALNLLVERGLIDPDQYDVPVRVLRGRAAFYGMMSAIACEQGIPAGLFDAMIIRESGYNPVAVSSANAYGLAQLMPGTAFGLGVDRYDPLQNMRGGARYLRQQLDRFGQVHLALAAYNAGPGRVRGGLVPRITETQAYVSNIIANWSRLTSPTGSTSTVSTLPQGYRSVAFTQF